MTAFGILFTIIFLVLIYIILYFLFSDKSRLTGTTLDGTAMTTIPAASMPSDSTGALSGNFSYSLWFFVNDWNYRYGDLKVLLGRMGQGSSAGLTTVSSLDVMQPCPAIILDALQNNLIVSVTCYSGSQGATPQQAGTIVHKCIVENVPIQKWVNVLISVYGRTLDVYLNGKLVKTCVLPGIAYINKDSPLYVTPSGGISGWTSNLQYWSNATDPQTAWTVYTNGYGASWLSTMFGNYSVKMSLLQDNKEASSVQF